MFPGGSEGFELVDCDLGIRGISCLLRVIQDGCSSDGSTARGIDSFWILFLRPPKDLTELDRLKYVTLAIENDC